jgi:hypothetical protein
MFDVQNVSQMIGIHVEGRSADKRNLHASDDQRVPLFCPRITNCYLFELHHPLEQYAAHCGQKLQAGVTNDDAFVK